MNVSYFIGFSGSLYELVLRRWSENGFSGSKFFAESEIHFLRPIILFLRYFVGGKFFFELVKVPLLSFIKIIIQGEKINKRNFLFDFSGTNRLGKFWTLSHVGDIRRAHIFRSWFYLKNFRFDVPKLNKGIRLKKFFFGGGGPET